MPLFRSVGKVCVCVRMLCFDSSEGETVLSGGGVCV